MGNMHPLVTIGIPTYNRASGYLKQALKSAISQTYSNIEIIVSDNCSSDHTEKVVRNFNDKRIRYFRQSVNIGSNKNGNFCLDQANGLYFLLLFDDDMIDSDFVEVCMNALNGNHRIGLVLTGAREIDANDNVLLETNNKAKGKSTEEFCLDWFAGKVPLYSCSVLMNTRRLREIGGLYSKTNSYEDVVADIQLAEYFGRANVFDVKASFRRHEQNMGSSIKIRDWCEDSIYLLDIMCKLASEKRVLRDKGMTYFCKRNYRRADKINSRVKRFFVYLMIFKTFQYKHIPPFAKLFNSNTQILKGVRFFKRKILQKN